MPLVSVIVPVYKVEKFLPRCLDSVLGQTFTDFELICVNDGSPDGCLQILKNYARKDKRIKVISQENQGLSMARNNGLKEASGQYVYFLDSDDFIHPQCLEITVFFAQKYQADLVSFDFVKGYDEKIHNKHYVCDEIPFQVSEKPVFLGTHKEKWRIAFNAWTKLFKREILNNVAYLAGIHFEDYPHTLGVLAQNPRTVVLKAPLYFYTLNENSISHQKINPHQIRDYHIGIRYVFEKYSLPGLSRERAFLKKHFLRRILKKQLSLCKAAAADVQPFMFEQFATELRDLDAQNLLPSFGLKSLTYRKIMKNFAQNVADESPKPLFRVAVFAAYDSEGKVSDYVLNYVRKLKEVCEKVVFVADNEAPLSEQKKLDGLVDFKQFKHHGEYDFGSYKIGYNWVLKQSWAVKVDEFILCNDSCFTVGPFKPVFDVMSFSRCDFWGMTLTNKITLHLQSFFLVFKKNVFQSAVFDKFMQSICAQKAVKNVIELYEVPLKSLLEKEGFRGTAYIQNLKSPHQRALTTLQKGMPFVKKKCFRKAHTLLDESCLENIAAVFWKMRQISVPDYVAVCSYLKVPTPPLKFILYLMFWSCFFKFKRFLFFKKVKNNGYAIIKVCRIPVYRWKTSQNEG